MRQLSNRVRRLHFQTDALFVAGDLSSVTAQHLCHVLNVLGADSFFQNLHGLSLEIDSSAAFDDAECTFLKDYKNCITYFIRSLIHPHLSALRMNSNTAKFVHLNLPSLPTCPRMRYLNIERNSWPDEHELSSALSNVASSFSSLEVVRCNGISWKDLNCLAQLDVLRQLWVDLPDHINASYCPTIERNVFPELRALNMITGTLQSSVEFLRSTALDKLTDLNISCTYVAFNAAIYDVSEDIQDLLSLIPSQRHQLESVRVNSGVWPLAPLPWVLDMSVLSPYIPLRNLRILDIETHYSPALTDGDLVEMAKAWPCLEQLHLVKESGWQLPTGLTLQGIVSLIQYCPRLESFSLVFDASVNHMLSCVPRRPDGTVIQNERVRYMDVCNSPIASPTHVAAFLSKLLPGLKIIGVDPYIKYRALWTEVAAQHCGWPRIEMFGQGELRSGCHGLEKAVMEVGEEWRWTLGCLSDSGSANFGDDGLTGMQRGRKATPLLPFQGLSTL